MDKDRAIKHYEHLHLFLQQQIDHVVGEQRNDGNMASDVVDTNVDIQNKAAIYKKCYNCDFSEIPKKQHTCPQCKSNVTKAQLQSMGIDDIGNSLEGIAPVPKHSKKVRVLIGEKDVDNDVAMQML